MVCVDKGGVGQGGAMRLLSGVVVIIYKPVGFGGVTLCVYLLKLFEW